MITSEHNFLSRLGSFSVLKELYHEYDLSLSRPINARLIKKKKKNSIAGMGPIKKNFC